MYLIKYTLTVKFSIKDYTRQLQCIKYEKLKQVMTTILPKKYATFGPKSQSTTKHRMFRAPNLRQSREFYTNDVGDVGDI